MAKATADAVSMGVLGVLAGASISLGGVFFAVAVTGSALAIAHARLDRSIAETFARAVLCNSLVCLAVWLSFAGPAHDRARRAELCRPSRGSTRAPHGSLQTRHSEPAPASRRTAVTLYGGHFERGSTCGPTGRLACVSGKWKERSTAKAEQPRHTLAAGLASEELQPVLEQCAPVGTARDGDQTSVT